MSVNIEKIYIYIFEHLALRLLEQPKKETE